MALLLNLHVSVCMWFQSLWLFLVFILIYTIPIFTSVLLLRRSLVCFRWVQVCWYIYESIYNIFNVQIIHSFWIQRCFNYHPDFTWGLEVSKEVVRIMKGHSFHLHHNYGKVLLAFLIGTRDLNTPFIENIKTQWKLLSQC